MMYIMERSLYRRKSNGSNIRQIMQTAKEKIEDPRDADGRMRDFRGEDDRTDSGA